MSSLSPFPPSPPSLRMFLAREGTGCTTRRACPDLMVGHSLNLVLRVEFSAASSGLGIIEGLRAQFDEGRGNGGIPRAEDIRVLIIES